MEYYRLEKNGSFRQIAALPKTIRLSVALGRFDGVHMGHQALLSATDNSGLSRAVWTLSSPDDKTPYIMSVPERLSICGRYGIEYAMCDNFENIKNMTPEEFVRNMLEKNNVKNLVCGYNFRFGKDRAGNSNILKREAARFGVSVTQVGEVEVNGISISATKIRELLSEGKIDVASELLSRPYFFESEVTEGKKIGRNHLCAYYKPKV